MYFFSSFGIMNILILGIEFLSIGIGGFFLVSCFSRLEVRNRLLPGIALGMVLYITFGNIGAQFITLRAASLISSGLILIIGIAAAWRHRLNILSQIPAADYVAQLVVFLGLIILFVFINRGLAILDDYHNLPLVSIISTGKVPPPFYLRTNTQMAYHYGLHLFSAFLVAQGGLFPWSAFDIGKAIMIALTISTAWIWFRQFKLDTTGLLISLMIFTLAGGTRWLLLFTPASWLQNASTSLNLFGAGHPTSIWLTENLTSLWDIEGAGPFPFPFAFASGVFHPLIFSLGSNSSLPVLTILLILLIRPEKWSLPAILLQSLCIASLGLTAELWLAILYIGTAIAVPVSLLRKKSLTQWLPWIAILAIPIPLILLQGGVATETFKNQFNLYSSNTLTTGFGHFEFQTIPTVISAHLGFLPLIKLNTLIIALLEIGPVLLLIPFSIIYLRRAWKEVDFAPIVLLLGTYFLSLITLFMHYSVPRDTARIIGNSGFLWLIAGLPILFKPENRHKFIWNLNRIVCSISTVSGLVFLSIMLISIKNPLQSYFITGPDAQISSIYWDKLEENAQIFDPYPPRSATIFGRISDAKSSTHVFLDSYKKLLDNPLPTAAAEAGFDYYYLDEQAYNSMSPEQQKSFYDSCVYSMEAIEDDLGNLRIFYDISSCR